MAIHIVPLGWEIDRVVEVLKRTKGTGREWSCTKLYLVVPHKKDAKHYPEDVRRAVKKLGAEVPPIIYVDKYRTKGGREELIEFESVLREVSKIIQKEAVDHEMAVLINISACSKVSALAAGVAAMATQDLVKKGKGTVDVYYVAPDHYARSDEERHKHGEGVGYRDARLIDLFPIHLPSNICMNLLGFLASQGGSASFETCMRHLASVPRSGIEDPSEYGTSARQRNKLRNRFRRLVDGMKKEGYVLDERDPANRRERRLMLQPHGRTVALLSTFKP